MGIPNELQAAFNGTAAEFNSFDAGYGDSNNGGQANLGAENSEHVNQGVPTVGYSRSFDFNSGHHDINQRYTPPPGSTDGGAMGGRPFRARRASMPYADYTSHSQQYRKAVPALPAAPLSARGVSRSGGFPAQRPHQGYGGQDARVYNDGSHPEYFGASGAGYQQDRAHADEGAPYLYNDLHSMHGGHPTSNPGSSSGNGPLRAIIPPRPVVASHGLPPLPHRESGLPSGGYSGYEPIHPSDGRSSDFGGLPHHVRSGGLDSEGAGDGSGLGRTSNGGGGATPLVQAIQAMEIVGSVDLAQPAIPISQVGHVWE